MNSPARKREFITVTEARMPTMRFYTAVFIAVMFAAESLAVTGEKSPSSGVESLGGRLLDDLSPDAAQTKTPPRPSQNAPATKEIEDSLKASTPLHGFGAGANPASQSLARVKSSMRHAQSLLTQSDADGKSGGAQLATPVQQQVLSDLDKLIADLSKQCQSCNDQCAGGQCNKPPKPGQNPKPGKSGGTGRTAARDSTWAVSSKPKRNAATHAA